MTDMETRDMPLNWEVFVTPGIPTVTSDLPPGTEQRLWSPISATLISGKRDAVLVDAFITVEQTGALVEWVAASGKNLTTIYSTHGHGDHFFGIGALLERFPTARAVATPAVVKFMQQQASPASIANFWNARFPGQIPDRLVIAEVLRERCSFWKVTTWPAWRMGIVKPTQRPACMSSQSARLSPGLMT